MTLTCRISADGCVYGANNMIDTLLLWLMSDGEQQQVIFTMSAGKTHTHSHTSALNNDRSDRAQKNCTKSTHTHPVSFAQLSSAVTSAVSSDVRTIPDAFGGSDISRCPMGRRGFMNRSPAFGTQPGVLLVPTTCEMKGHKMTKHISVPHSAYVESIFSC